MATEVMEVFVLRHCFFISLAAHSSILHQNLHLLLAYTQLLSLLLPSISLYSHSDRKAETFISHVYLNFNSNTRQSEHLRSICTRVSRELQKSSEVLYDLWLWSLEFCCYHKLNGNKSHHQHLVAGGGGGVWSSCEIGSEKSSKSVGGDVGEWPLSWYR